MKDLIAKDSKKMSSKEITELTGKIHKQVLRDIRNMFDSLDGTNLYPEQYQVVKLDNGMTGEVLLDHELSVLLITGYDVKARLAVIKRWKELEQQASKPKTALELAREQVMLLEHIEQQKAIIEQQAPKVAALDRIASGIGSMCLSDAAKIVDMPPQAFNRWLNKIEWIFKRTAGDNWTGYSDKIKAGYLEMTTYTQRKLGDETEKVFKQVKVTPKGLAKLSEMLSAGGAV